MFSKTNGTLFSRHTWLAFIIVLAVLYILKVNEVYAAQGDLVGTLDTPVHCTSGIGVSVAFDGTHLYYSCYQDPNLYKVRPPLGSVMRANPSTPIKGTLVATLNTGLPNGLGAMAWDPSRRMLWAGTLKGDHGIYLVDPNTGSATLKFYTPPVPINFHDGLAYDGSDDTLWFSDDVDYTIYHLKTDGTVINTFSVSFPSSGLAVGGTTLFAGSNGWGNIYKLDKNTGQQLGIFASPGGRDEDMACDDVTFAGINALWSKDAYNNLVYAFEIPAGSCNTGGKGYNLSDVPDYKQTDPIWKNDPYDWKIVDGQKVSRGGWTIGGSGCFITSAVNIMRYWDVTKATNSSDVNPRTINDYLSDEFLDEKDNHIGYDKWGGASWAGIQKYSGGKVSVSSLTLAPGQSKEQAIDAQLALSQPVMVGVPIQGYLLYKDLSLSYQNDLNQGTISNAFREEFTKITLTKRYISLSPNDQLLIWKIANNRWWIHDTAYTNQSGITGDTGYIATIRDNSIYIYEGNKDGHYVVIVGTKVNGQYPIRDPGGYQGKDTGSYGGVDGIGKIRLIKPANGYKPLQRIAAYSPVELLIIDPLGRRTGFDPLTQTTYNEIPEAVYEIENPIVDQDENGGPLGEPVKVLYLPQPEAGSYILKVMGIGDGPFTLDFQTLDADGNFSSETRTGLAFVGSSTEYPYEYDGDVISLHNPWLTVPDAQIAQQGRPLSFDIFADDPDVGDELELSVVGLPEGLNFTDHGDNTGSVSGVVTASPAIYTTWFTVTDSTGLSDAKFVSIEVINNDIYLPMIQRP